MVSEPRKLLFVAALAAGFFLSSARAESEDGDSRQAKIFAYYSTTSVTKLTTTTITGLSTCFSTASQAAQGACQGRKKRMVPSVINEDLATLDDEELTGSMDEEFEASDLVKREASPDRQAKKLTIWSTNYTTITITTTSIPGMTTISATALCTYPNQSNTCFGN